MTFAGLAVIRRWVNSPAAPVLVTVACFLSPLLARLVQAGDFHRGACVLSVRGEWIAGSNSEFLKRGSIVPPGTEVRNRNRANGDDFIVLVDVDNRVVQKRCAVDRCNEPLFIANEENSSAFSEVIAAVSELWRKDEQRYRSLLSRGSELQDGVLELREDGSVDLIPLLKHATAEPYRIHLERLSSRGDTASKEFDLIYHSAQGFGAPASDLAPGLYSMKVSAATSNPGPTDKAWVLVVRSKVFADINSRFQSAKRETEAWKDTADPSAARSFLRAYLDSLAQSMEQGQ